MKMIKKIFAFSLALVMLLNTCLFVSAEAESVTIDKVMMTVGADETMRNLTWFADVDASGEVRYAKTADMIGNQFPAEYSVAPAIAKSTELAGIYSYKATMRGLEENTSYVYCIVVDGTVSKNYTFDVKTFSNDFSFTFVTDVQVVDEGFGADWIDTMNKFQTLNEFKDSSIIVSGGDQVDDSDEALYDMFINESLSSIAFAPTWGRLHDQGNLYDSHYNLPNLSSTYGNEMNTSDYYYTYNNVLFMHINTETADYKSGYEGHKAFLENAVATNPDCTWKIVVLHFSFFTGGRHSTDSRVTGFRDALAGTFNDLGVDLVLSGHDHVYTRSNLMLDGTTISEDVVTNNTVTDPEGTLYICGTKASYRNFYDVVPAPTNPEIARFEDSDRKSAVTFDITDESLTLRAYFLDGDEPEQFDNFTIYKTDYTPAEMPDCYSVTYVDELGHNFGDSTDISLYAKRYFTTATPDEPRLSVPSGSLDEGKKLNWYWEYYQVNGNGTETTEFVNGNEYVAYLRCDIVKISRNITIASETDVSECIYTWEDAWELLYQYPGEAFTFTLSEDITVTTTVSVKAAVNVTIDLNGKTLTATGVASHLFEIPKDGAGSALKVISTKAGGVLDVGKRSFSRLESGKGSEISMQFGSADTYPITVTTNTLVLGKSSFYSATYNLNIYGGTYNFGKSIVDIRNDGTNYNTYCFNLNDANINMTSSSYTFFYRFDDKCAGVNSSFNANNCVFTGKNTTTPKDFFGSEMWMGTASFRDCVFNNVVFDSNLHTNLKGITFGANCVFNNSGNTFAVITEEPEVPQEPEIPDEPTVPTSINYNFALYDHPLFSELISGNGSKYSKYEKEIEAAYPDDQNWIVENQDPDITAANLTFFTDQGMRMTLGAGNWGALRLYVPNSARYDIVLTSLRQSMYTAKTWLLPAPQGTMTVSEIEAAMIDSNALNNVNSNEPDYSCSIGQRDFAAGEYILIFQANEERVYLGNIDLIEIPVENDTEEPEDTGNADWEDPVADSSLGFVSKKVLLEDGCVVTSLGNNQIATVNKDSILLEISANQPELIAGRTVKYTVSCKNLLAADVSLTLSALVPSGTSFVSADNSGTVSGNSVFWKLTIPADSTVSVTYEVNVNESGVLVNQATATVDGLNFTTNKVACDLKIAKIGDKDYSSLEDALTDAVSGDVVVLLSNLKSEDLILPSGISLDLNGYTLIADSVLSYSSSAIIDNSENVGGLLKINDAEGNMISKDNEYLPVYDNVNGGYRFFAVGIESCAVTSGNKYWFKVDAQNFEELNKLIRSGSEVLIKVKMTWDGQEEAVFAAADLAFTQTWASHYSTNGNTYITVSVTENEGVENFTLTPIVTANSVEISGEEM